MLACDQALQSARFALDNMTLPDSFSDPQPSQESSPAGGVVSTGINAREVARLLHEVRERVLEFKEVVRYHADTSTHRSVGEQSPAAAMSQSRVAVRNEDRLKALKTARLGEERLREHGIYIGVSPSPNPLSSRHTPERASIQEHAARLRILAAARAELASINHECNNTSNEAHFASMDSRIDDISGDARVLLGSLSHDPAAY